MQLLSPSGFSDYELIDCGDFRKLERFGKYITIRPEPQAVWHRNLSEKDWKSQAHVEFVPYSSSAGDWKKLKEMPDRWNISYSINGNDSQKINLRLALTSFKHVGVFPEQAVNWDYIFSSLKKIENPAPKFLNLFAYTGAASLAAKRAGADVTHLDSIKQVVSWSRENMELSGLDNIRWVIEDALKFVKREVKRGNTYNGIILDPPAFGHGPDGEKWKIEDQISDMMQHVLQLLNRDKHFLILNAYSLGFSSIIIENLLRDFAGKNLETGELFLPSSTGLKLPLGVFGRFKNF